MKKHVLLIIALLTSLNLFSQKPHRSFGREFNKDTTKNELKLNLGTTIFGSYPEITYERVLDSDISIGAALGFSLDDDLYPVNFAFTPYLRWFFGGSSENLPWFFGGSSQNLHKFGAGFFIEANGGILSKKNNEGYYENDIYGSRTKTELGAGLGVAIGWKHLSKNNWVGEIYFGGGRDFINEGSYPRVGLTIGKRF